MRTSLFTLLFALALTAFFQGTTFAQTQDPLKVTELILDNGLTIMLNEDHSEPKIFGGIAVKAGSKNDPADATGIAHYFEHIMFKGTDQIGTLDYTKEKVYLDSITMMYDKLGNTKDEKERNAIQLSINALSIKSAQYAIPNETDKLLKKFGSIGLNAGTSFEQTVYYNSFPPEQIERWLAIYSERFRNPVFRLFQSELETVYEEQNMYADQMGHELQTDLLKRIFQKHPYGQQPLIGTIEHLKNPSLSKMEKFYHDYYVANNMALILTGDFNTQEIIPLIREKFGKLPSGNIPLFDNAKYKEEPFKGREFYSVKLMPIRIEIIAFRGVPNKNEDEQTLNLCLSILSNENETGILDQLKVKNLVTDIQVQSLQLNDEGAIMLVIIPKIVGGKSMQELEKMVMAGIDSLKTGKFDDALVSSLKLNYRKNHLLSLESITGKAQLLLSSYLAGYSWQDILDDADKYDQIRRQDIVATASTYFSSNRMVYYNKMGIPKKGNKIQKPDLKPIPSLNTDKQSEFAKAMDLIATRSPDPVFIDFNTDFTLNNIRDRVHMYATSNPVNDIFTFTLKFGVGTYTDKKLGPAADLIKELGTHSKTSQELKKEMQKIGTSYSFSTDINNFSVSVTGFDENLQKSIQLISEILTDLKPDESQMDRLIQNIKAEEKMAKKDQNSISDALFNYVLYKEQSPFIDRLTLRDIKKLSTTQLIQSIKQVLNFETDVYYAGKLNVDSVGRWVNKYIPFANGLYPKTDSLLHVLPYSKNEIFICDNPKAIQSSINVIVPGGKTSRQEKLKAGLFSEYFGRGMSSILFQEIREFRSLAYSVYANFTTYSNNHPEEKGYLRGFLTTQSDKTFDALNITDSLISNMPVRPERLEIIKQSYKESVNSIKPNFRALPSTASTWLNEGFTQDPRKEKYDFVKNSNFTDITEFYEIYVKSHPKIYILTGKAKNMKMKKLGRFGEINTMDIKKIRRY